MSVSRAALRQAWLKLHRWIALTLGALLVLAGLLGAVLVVAKPLDRWAHPELFERPAAAAAGPMASLERLRQGLQREFGPGASFTFRPPRKPQDTSWVFVRGPWEGVVYFDPATGRELGRRGEREGAYNLLFELHSSLLAGDTGKAILTLAAGAYVAILITGLSLWWPARWPPSLRVRLKGNALRALFDVHSLGGALLGIAIAVPVVSGAYTAWPPLRAFVSGVAGSQLVQPPVVTRAAPDAIAALPLDEFVSRATTQFPGALVGYVQLPASRVRPVRVRLKLSDDPHPNGLTSVWLHPATAEILAVLRWNELDSGYAAMSVIYPLHTGELGGVALEAVNALVGLSLAVIGGAGIWLWWKRRRRLP